MENEKNEALAPTPHPHKKIDFDCLLHMGIRTALPFAKDMAEYHANITIDEKFLTLTFTKAHKGIGKKAIVLRFDKFRYPEIEFGKTATVLNENTQATFHNYAPFKSRTGLAKKANYIMFIPHFDLGPFELSINGKSKSIAYMLCFYNKLALYLWEDNITTTVWDFLKENLPQY